MLNDFIYIKFIKYNLICNDREQQMVVAWRQGGWEGKMTKGHEELLGVINVFIIWIV